MKRTPLPPRQSPMPRKRAKPRRTAEPEENQPNIAPKVRKALKSRSARPKMTPARKSARGQHCTLDLTGCQNNTETVVLCHIRMFSGGGIGLKPPDIEAVYACSHCHDILDGRAKGHVLHVDLLRALIHTHRIMLADGVLVMKCEGE